MQVRMDAVTGKTVVKLQKNERRWLDLAHSVCVGLSRITGEEVEANAAAALTAVCDKYCKGVDDGSKTS